MLALVPASRVFERGPGSNGLYRPSLGGPVPKHGLVEGAIRRHVEFPFQTWRWTLCRICRDFRQERSVFVSMLFQGRKRNPNPNFLIRIFSSGVGVFHVNGWGQKVRYVP